MVYKGHYTNEGKTVEVAIKTMKGTVTLLLCAN